MFTKLNKANFDTATNYTMCQTPGASLFDSRQDKSFFLFSKEARPALRPTQPLIQWVLGHIFWGGKTAGT
jgi:hypothetical protein